jgi:GNAT superfamily N-acetyltransferase
MVDLVTMSSERLRKKLMNWCASKHAPKIAKEFPYIWTRNQSWEKHPPVVAMVGRQIVGFEATAYTSTTLYCNLYYVAVDNRFQGKGIGSMLIERALKIGHQRGMARWTNKSHAGSEGEQYFSKHLGIPPIGLMGNQVLYDWSIHGIGTCYEISKAVAYSKQNFLRLEEIPERKLKQYAKVTAKWHPKLQIRLEALMGKAPQRFPRTPRFPRFTKGTKRIINLRGTNGSGKSTIVQELMEHFGIAKILRRKENDRIWAYRLKSKRPLYILGRYDTACGGCDVFQNLDMVVDGIRKLSKKGDVIFEGILISGGSGRWVALQHELKHTHMIFGILDTPLEKCINRVLRRRKKKGNKKPFNSKNLTEKWKSTIGCGKLLEREWMDVRPLHYKTATRTVLQWLKAR